MVSAALFLDRKIPYSKRFAQTYSHDLLSNFGSNACGVLLEILTMCELAVPTRESDSIMKVVFNE